MSLFEEIELFKNSKSSAIKEQFWKENSSNYPRLFKVFCSLKSITPSNAAIERLFLAAKLLESDLRSKMSPESLEMFLIGRNKF